LTVTCERHQHLDPGRDLALARLADQRDVVVEQAADLRDRRRLVDEIGERHLDVCRLGLEAIGHLEQHLLERLDADLLLAAVEDLDEA
jgi:hypothetical protein